MALLYRRARLAAATALSSFGDPFNGARRYGNSLAKNAELMNAPSVYFNPPAGASAGAQPTAVFTPDTVQRTPIATRSSMSTTSSPGRRPFGKPAASPPSTPSRLWLAAGVGAIAVLSRSISDGVTFDGLFRPCTPVRKAATRSVRGKLVGAFTPALPNSASRSAGSVGLVT